MKIRFFIYSSFLFGVLMLPLIYKNMNYNVQKQEQINRQQKKDWLDRMANIELDLASKSTGKYSFWHHFIKFTEYFKLELAMMREDLNNI